jgi:hypothetical protein
LNGASTGVAPTTPRPSTYDISAVRTREINDRDTGTSSPSQEQAPRAPHTVNHDAPLG